MHAPQKKHPFTLSITLLVLLLSFQAKATVTVGQLAPNVQFVDLDGKKGSTRVTGGKIGLISFAGKESSSRLEETIRPINLKLMKRYPDIEMVYVGFADLTEVPQFLEKMVNAIIRFFNNRVKAEMNELYQKNGVAKTAAKAAFHLTPDWEGTYLKAFHLDKGDPFHCWLVYEGRIIAALPEGTPQFEAKFLAAIDSVMKR